jgi:signal transduction histidine kinase
VHADRTLDITIDMTPGAVFQGERDDLEEMLGNLLDNACKWARARVTLDVAVRAGRLRLVVDDDGPGMAQNEMQAALRRGVRFDERVTGSGLGLAIVLDLAESYGGRLTLRRSSLGGLAAELDLPAA